MKLARARVLLTGATGGIGEASARRLAADGASLLLVARNANVLEHLADELRQQGSDVASLSADICDAMDRRRIAEAARRFGVNVLVNNAGVNRHGLFAKQSDLDIESVVMVNAVATMQLTRLLLDQLAGLDEAGIVNVGSALGAVTTPGQAVYGASKAALKAFSEGLRREYSLSQLAVSYVAPRATDTDMNDDEVRELNEALGVATDPPERVAGVIARAIEAGGAEYYIGWPERLFVRLNGLMPGLVDQGLKKHTRLLTQSCAQAFGLAPESGGKQ